MKDHRPRITLAGSCAVHGLQDGLTSSVNVLLPIFATHFGLSYAQVGAVRAAYSAAMFLLELPSGLAAERFGERWLLVFGLLCAGTGYITASQVSTYPALMAALFAAGTGAAFQHSLNSALVSRSFDGPARTVALGTYNSAGDFGKLMATGLLSVLLGAGAGWSSVTAAYGVAAIVAAAVIAAVFLRLRIGDTPPARPVVSPAPASPAGPAGPAGPAIRRLLQGITDRRGFGVLCTVVLLDTLVQDGFLVFVSFLMLNKGVPPELAAFAIVLTLSGGVVGKFGCGFLARRLGPIRAFVLLEVLTAVGIATVYLAPALVAYCLLPLLGVVLQGSTTITYGAVGDFVDENRRSRAYGFIYSMSSTASVLGPVGFGFIGDQLGLGSAAMAMSIAVLLTLPCCVLLGPALARARAA